LSFPVVSKFKVACILPVNGFLVAIMGKALNHSVSLRLAPAEFKLAVFSWPELERVIYQDIRDMAVSKSEACFLNPLFSGQF